MSKRPIDLQLPLRFERRGLPITSVDEWFARAPPMGGPAAWRDGASQKELAKAWFGRGVSPVPPAELLALLANLPQLGPLEFEVGYPQHRVQFAEGHGSLQRTDLAVLCTGITGRVALSIIAKAHEGFGRSVGEEIMGASAQWAFEEREDRLEGIRRLAELFLQNRRATQPRLAELKFQLLNAVGAAIAFASQKHATIAVLAVHEFLRESDISERVEESRQDLNRIVDRITNGGVRTLDVGQLIGPLAVPHEGPWVGVHEWYVGKCRTALTTNHVVEE